ncbi:MAG: TlpA family protein disulfide reductase [Solirubrobacterales bacterium]
MRLRRRLLLAVLSLAAAVTLTACGADDDAGEEGVQTGEPGVTEVSTKGLPKALAQNRAQANQIIDGSTEALDAKLTELRGHPVVVNQWGSWCPPCQAEFPFFSEVAEAHAADVAFVGVDIQDDRDAAEEFLKDFPVPYPSIYDRDAEAVFSLNWTGVSPTTWFIDGRGGVVHQRPGGYPDGEALEADIESFLLSG